MKPIGLLCLATAVGLLLAAWLLWRPVDERGPGVPVAPAEAHVADSPAELELVRLPAVAQGTSAAAATADAVEATAVPGPRVRGIVLDPAGGALAGLAVTWVRHDRTRIPDAAVAASDRSGAFELGRPPEVGARLVVDAASWTTLLEPVFYEAVDEVPVVLVAVRSVAIRGHVLDAAGAGIAGAAVSLRAVGDYSARIPHVLDRSAQRTWNVQSDAEGRFEIADAPEYQVEAVAASARHGVVRRRFDPVPLFLELVFRGDENALLDGLVGRADGGPVAGAVVSCGDQRVLVDASGRFEIDLRRVFVPHGGRVHLRAGLAGFVAVDLANAEPEWRTRSAWPEHIVLTLSMRCLSIRGRVLAADGEPVACEVDVVGRDPWPDALGPSEAAVFAPLGMGSPPPPTGSFVVDRLPPGLHRLHILVKDSLQSQVTEPIAAGTADVEVRLPPARAWPELRTSLVARDGKPVAGVEWWLEGPAPAAGAPAVRGASFRTQESGEVRLAMVAESVSHLVVRVDGLAAPQRFALIDLGQPGHTSVVTMPAHVRVHGLDPNEGIDAVAVLDDAGQRLALVVTEGDEAAAVREIAAASGQTRTFRSPDSGVALLLLRGGREVRRVPVTLRRDTPNVLQP